MTSDPKGDFLSGTSGQVWGKRATGKAFLADAYAEARALISGLPWRLRRAAQSTPCRRVLALGIELPDGHSLLPAARDELLRSRHDVMFASAPAGDRGKFQNLNALLRAHAPQGHDWLLVIDDDVALPVGFLDAFLFLLERFDLRLAQPAHRARSHAAWRVTRRRPGSVMRQTAYVEIGPVVAFHPDTFGVLLPFPELRSGWGLDAHWAALAAEHRWRLGIVDATPIRHGTRRIAAHYDRDAAIEEAGRFLDGRPYLRSAEAQRTLVTHRKW